MSSSSFVERFSRLEIPEERKRLDWRFLEEPLNLPLPLPLAGERLLVLVNGRALTPVAAPPGGERGVVFYRQEHALEEGESPAAAEASYREWNRQALEREQRRFLASVPTSIIREPLLVSEAIEILEHSGAADRWPEEAKALAATTADHLPPLHGAAPTTSAEAGLLSAQLTGYARLLRLHDKLYDLLSLREYVRIFEKAIEPGCFRRLQALPESAAPQEMLDVIAASLDQIHARARSPLRNKMECARVRFNGITLLPLYREPASALFEGYGQLLQRHLKVEALRRHAGQSSGER
jgi:hypothetical protein